jgi:hypothetical protein
MWVRARSYINDPIGLEKWGTQPKEKRGEETQEREEERMCVCVRERETERGGEIEMLFSLLVV